MEIPIYFVQGLQFHHNFEYFFEELKYFNNKPIKILHLGAYTGHGTRWMLEKANATCVDVDTWEGSTTEKGHLFAGHENFYDNRIEDMYDKEVAGLPTTKFKGTTEEFFKQNKEAFDFIYIDASHNKADVANDLVESFKVLNPGGVIACDDYLWMIHDENMKLDASKLDNFNMDDLPYEAIKEFIELNKYKVKVLIDNYQLWFKKL
jgi:predicted O-methyltransferase YrrM